MLLHWMICVRMNFMVKIKFFLSLEKIRGFWVVLRLFDSGVNVRRGANIANQTFLADKP